MKGLLLSLALLAVGSTALAQANGGLKGPAAKNYKYWLDKNKPIATETVTITQKPEIGPAAKNKTWHNKKEAYKYVPIATVTARPRVIGHAAKRVRPFDFQYD